MNKKSEKTKKTSKTKTKKVDQYCPKCMHPFFNDKKCVACGFEKNPAEAPKAPEDNKDKG